MNKISFECSPKVFSIWTQMEAEGHETRIVGGFVRDMVMGYKPKDMDFCTTMTPEQMIDFAARNGFRVEPTGMQHGTVSFIVDGEAFEFTTLRIDTDCDGRHASVQFTTDFEADAARRDFTFNAMSMDIAGNVFDYFGGWEDAQNKTIRFVGNANERIAEDYLRVLRFFRFAARYDANMDWDALNEMRQPRVHAGLAKVSRERIWAEVAKIAVSPAREAAMVKMVLTGVSMAVGMQSNEFAQAAIANAKNAPSFMAGFCGSDPVAFGRAWKMSIEEISMMSFVHSNSVMTTKTVAGMRLDGIRKDRVVSACEVHAPEFVEFAKSNFPTFPVTGKDLMEEGFEPGVEMGRELDRRRKAWKAAVLKEVP